MLIELYALIIIFLFGFFCIFYDLKFRKIPNKLIIFFFIISLFFLYLNKENLNYFSLFLFFFILIIILIMFHFKLIGAADGKVFILLSLIIGSILGHEGEFNFFINLVLLYSITMSIFTLIVTDFKAKKKVFKKLKLYEHLFFVLFIFIFGKILHKYFFLSLGLIPSIVFLLFFGIFLFLFTDKIKNFFRKESETFLIWFNLGLFVLFLYLTDDFLLNFFLIVLFVKIAIDYISRLSLEIYENKKVYESPFSIYLFFSAFLTLLIKTNIISIIFYILGS